MTKQPACNHPWEALIDRTTLTAEQHRNIYWEPSTWMQYDLFLCPQCGRFGIYRRANRGRTIQRIAPVTNASAIADIEALMQSLFMRRTLHPAYALFHPRADAHDANETSSPEQLGFNLSVEERVA